jgi:hypothetical protein
MAMSLFGKAQFRTQVGAWIAAAAVGATSVMAQQAASPVQPSATVAPAKAAKAPAKKKAAQDDSKQADGAPSPAAGRKDPAEAIRQVESGIKLLQAQKAEQAIQTLTVAISSGALPPTHMARALHQRGAAYRSTGKPALAISDLTSALWLKGGLADADRQDAVKQRAEAYRAAGLPDQTGDDGQPAGAAPSKRASIGTATAASAATAPVATASLAPGAAPAAPSSGNLLQTLFGGLGKSQAVAAQPAPVAASGAASPATSGWSSAVIPTRAPKAIATTPSTVPAAVAAPAAVAPAAAVRTSSIAPPAAQAAAVGATASPAASGVHARIALVRNEAEAQPILTRLKTQHGAALGKQAVTLSQAQFGGMGAFVQVRVGPYGTMAEANAFCAKLKGSNLDCVAVDR